MKFGKKIIVFAILGTVFYFLLSYHYIVIGRTVKMLKKSHLTLEYTFFNAKGKSNEWVLSIDDLRYDGIGDILLEMDRISEEGLESLTAKIENEYE